MRAPRVLIHRLDGVACRKCALRHWRMLLEWARVEGIGARIADPPEGKGEEWAGVTGGQSSKGRWERL